jgi:hypothetical protein
LCYSFLLTELPRSSFSCVELQWVMLAWFFSRCSHCLFCFCRRLSTISFPCPFLSGSWWRSASVFRLRPHAAGVAIPCWVFPVHGTCDRSFCPARESRLASAGFLLAPPVILLAVQCPARSSVLETSLPVSIWRRCRSWDEATGQRFPAPVISPTAWPAQDSVWDFILAGIFVCVFWLWSSVSVFIFTWFCDVCLDFTMSLPALAPRFGFQRFSAHGFGSCDRLILLSISTCLLFPRGADMVKPFSLSS